MRGHAVFAGLHGQSRAADVGPPRGTSAVGAGPPARQSEAEEVCSVKLVRRNVEKEMGLTPVYVNYMPRHETHTLMPTFKAVNDQDEDHLYAA